ncbi:GNAT family N-acetyltransferase [Rhizobium sp. BR 362]|uniref:GNAT family N-acetyltransferase n=1 Tax=Rhizobium sp. BR 362 TaxID=3040670 RepID=UPI002F421FC7
MPDITISVLDNPSEDDHRAILNPLLAFNRAKTGDDRYEPVALVLRDATNQTVGGLWAKLYYDWLFVELLFVPESLRGNALGSKLLKQAEQLAKEKGCVGIWLDTFSFQAPGFYEKQGYERFGTLPDYPRGRERVFFRKVF